MTSNRFKLAVLIVVTLFFVSGSSLETQTRQPTSPVQAMSTAPAVSVVARPIYAPSPDSDTPTQEQINFVHKQIFPCFSHIRAYYPIPELRAQFDRFLLRTQGGDVRIRLESKRFHGDCTAAMATRINGQLTMVLFIPVLIDIWNEIGERETIADLMVGILLHEQYHLDHHANMSPERVTRHIQIGNEADAWWYSIEECYLPMMKAGRLTNLRNDGGDQAIFLGLRAFNQANGDRNASAWRQFADSMSSAPR